MRRWTAWRFFSSNERPRSSGSGLTIWRHCLLCLSHPRIAAVPQLFSPLALGPIQLLTRQPTEGRAKEGGLRLGEMEKDTFVAHGAALALKERFDSDKTIVPVCEGCGIIAIYDSFKDKRFCPLCGENVDINDVEMSYAFKLILDEFKALGVYPRIELENKY